MDKTSAQRCSLQHRTLVMFQFTRLHFGGCDGWGGNHWSPPKVSHPQLQRMGIHFSAALLERKFWPMKSVVGFSDNRLLTWEGSCSQHWYFNLWRMENMLAESLFWPHNTGMAELCIQQKIVVPTMESRRGERDELGAGSTANPKHTLQIFLLWWDTQVKPSQCFASQKTHTPTSVCPR